MPATGLIQLTVTQPAITERMRQAVEQSIQIVERRINELGTVEPLIQRQGVDRILVQVPGLDDPERIIELIGTTAKLDFRMVDSSVSPEQAQQGRRAAESELLYGTARTASPPYVIEKRVMVSGEDLTDAQPGFDQRTSEPIVNFKFNTNGARRFAQVDAGERRPAVRDRARQRGDLGAGDPRADPRRLRARFPAASRSRARTTSRCCCARARCRRR